MCSQMYGVDLLKEFALPVMELELGSNLGSSDLLEK
jgi:hypothetical protein